MRCLVVDGNSILNRAFYGVRPLSNREGIPTNAIYGTLNILLKIIEEEKFEAACVCFDRKEKTFRHEKFDAYKAGRRPMPDELAAQMPLFKELLDHMGIHRMELAGFEADDLIGTAVRKLSGTDCQPVILTGDRDSLQLIDDAVHLKLVITKGGRSETIEYDRTRFLIDYGFEPIRLIDLKALWGDPSDGIPGVAGVGEKTGRDLISRFESLEYIYENLDSLDIRDTLREKLRAGRDSAFMSYELATIDCGAPIDFDCGCVKIEGGDRGKLFALLDRLELRGIIKRLGLKPGDAPVEPDARAEEENADVISDYSECGDPAGLLEACRGAVCDFYTLDGLNEMMVAANGKIFHVSSQTAGYDAFLKGFFSDTVKKRGHFIKPVQLELMKRGLPFGGFVFDTMLGAYVLSTLESGYELEKTAYKRLGLHIEDASAFTQTTLDDTERLRAGARCVSCIGLLAAAFEKEIAERKLEKLYYEVELPLSEVIASMEQVGFLVDREALSAFGEELSEGIEKARGEIYELAEGEFNIGSPKQLGEVLFERLELPAVRRTKSGYSTDIDVLNKLKDQHPIIEKIMTYRSLTKLKSTYADALVKVISDDGRIHSSFNQVGTATGRISSSEPNMQNIPVRSEYGSRIRSMFVAAPGCVLADADYSQIELRILASIAGDEVLSRAFREGHDVHTATASYVFKVPMGEVTSEMRRRAKAVNFGIVYGISDFSLGEDIGVPRYEAKGYIESYLEEYSGVRAYMKEVVARAKEQGYVETVFGRRRYLPDLKASNFNVRSAAERIALNTPIQGSAADVIKLAMCGVYYRLKSEGLRARLILQVHDELIVECPEAEAEDVRLIVEQEMENAVVFDPPLEAEVSIGHNWLEVK